MNLRYGLIGCGGFGQFCLQEYLRMPNVGCVAVADENENLARDTAKRFKVDHMTTEELLGSERVDLVHLATPPHTHGPLGLRALEAGKHLLCEKPLALTMEQAECMLRTAAENGCVLAVNLIMRYNPLCGAVKQIIRENLLGEPLFASFINAAQDEVLPPSHWFWDPGKSGGIFVEHGVHFFDLFEWWFGEGDVVAAVQAQRPGTALTDQVACTVKYGEATLAHFYHGFHQLLRHDRQHWKIVCELGDLTLSEWVPTTMTINAMLPDTAVERLKSILPQANCSVVKRYGASENAARSRNRSRTVDLHFSAVADAGRPKMDLYGHTLRQLLADQITRIHNREHRPLVDETNGLRSLRAALAAQAKADGFCFMPHGDYRHRAGASIPPGRLSGSPAKISDPQ